MSPAPLARATNQEHRRRAGDDTVRSSMDVLSTTARPVASLVWQPRPGAWVLTVVSKATYLLRPGECPLAPVQ
jgi:hypothetical protein